MPAVTGRSILIPYVVVYCTKSDFGPKKEYCQKQKYLDRAFLYFQIILLNL